jgi:hypothetical protein
MGAQGKTTVDFGAWPGSGEASTVITGQAGILAGSCYEAWLIAEDTQEHSADEHLLEENLRVMVGGLSAGTGYTIYAQVIEPPLGPDPPYARCGSHSGTAQAGASVGVVPTMRGNTRLYGRYTVGWVWN